MFDPDILSDTSDSDNVHCITFTKETAGFGNTDTKDDDSLQSNGDDCADDEAKN
jgi:hypothetical protein